MSRELVQVKLVSAMPVVEFDGQVKNRRGEHKRERLLPGAARAVWVVVHPSVQRLFTRRKDAVAAARRAGLRVA